MKEIISIIVIAGLFVFVAYKKYQKRKHPPKYWEGHDPARDKNVEVEVEKEKSRRPPPTIGGGGGSL